MFLVLILMLFLTLSFYLFNAEVAVRSSSELVSKVVQKERAFVLLKSLIPTAEKLLNKYTNGGSVSLVDPWAKPIEVETPLGKVNIKVVDLDRYLNLNALSNRAVRETFSNLLGELKIDGELLERILQWEGLKPYAGNWSEYPPPKRPMISKYELLLIWNNTGDLFGKKVGILELPGLLELTTVHSDGKVNVNTAPYWVLLSLPRMDPVTLGQIIEMRKDRKITDLQQLLTIGVDSERIYLWSNVLKTTSRYFEVVAALNSTSTPLTVRFIYDIVEKRVIEKEVR